MPVILLLIVNNSSNNCQKIRVNRVFVISLKLNYLLKSTQMLVLKYMVIFLFARVGAHFRNETCPSYCLVCLLIYFTPSSIDILLFFGC